MRNVQLTNDKCTKSSRHCSIGWLSSITSQMPSSISSGESLLSSREAQRRDMRALRDRLRRRPTKALATLGAASHVELLDITRPSRQEFAARHGYEVIEETTDLGEGRPLSWGKVRLLQRLVATFDQVFWIDADAILVDSSLDVADDMLDQDLGLVSHRYAGQVVPNAGVLFLRSTPWTADFLQRQWAATEFIDHKWWDNAALLHLTGFSTTEPVQRVRETRDAAHVCEIPQRWNVIPQAEAATPTIVHLPGFPHATRLDLMSRLAANPADATSILHGLREAL
jgi:hypothetical protein